MSICTLQHMPKNCLRDKVVSGRTLAEHLQPLAPLLAQKEVQRLGNLWNLSISKVLQDAPSMQWTGQACIQTK